MERMLPTQRPMIFTPPAGETVSTTLAPSIVVSPASSTSGSPTGSPTTLTSSSPSLPGEVFKVNIRGKVCEMQCRLPEEGEVEEEEGEEEEEGADEQQQGEGEAHWIHSKLPAWLAIFLTGLGSGVGAGITALLVSCRACARCKVGVDKITQNAGQLRHRVCGGDVPHERLSEEEVAGNEFVHLGFAAAEMQEHNPLAPSPIIRGDMATQTSVSAAGAAAAATSAAAGGSGGEPQKKGREEEGEKKGRE